MRRHGGSCVLAGVLLVHQEGMPRSTWRAAAAAFVVAGKHTSNGSPLGETQAASGSVTVRPARARSAAARCAVACSVCGVRRAAQRARSARARRCGSNV